MNVDRPLAPSELFISLFNNVFSISPCMKLMFILKFVYKIEVNSLRMLLLPRPLFNVHYNTRMHERDCWNALASTEYPDLDRNMCCSFQSCVLFFAIGRMQGNTSQSKLKHWHPLDSPYISIYLSMYVLHVLVLDIRDNCIKTLILILSCFFLH